MRKLARALPILAGVALLFPAAPAQAHFHVCTENNTYEFDPGLTLLTSSGPMTQHYSVACQHLHATTSPPSVSVLPQSASSTHTFFYGGTCVFASYNSGVYGGFLIGGVVAVTTKYSDLTYLRIGVLVPNTPCGETVAAGPEVSVHS